MSNRDQSGSRKSEGNFELLGGREPAVRLPLQLAEVWEELQAEGERLRGDVGLKILHATLRRRGVEENGRKQVRGMWEGATEKATVCKAGREDLVERGLDCERRYGVVIDGSKALRAAVAKVFGAQAEVQRCPLHKRRKVKDPFPEPCRADYDPRLRNAYAMTSYSDAKQALERVGRRLSSRPWRDVGHRSECALNALS